MNIHIENSWNEILQEEFEKPYFKQIIQFLEEEKKNGKAIFPFEKDIFNAFNYTTFHNIKVVLIGQDPYHNEGQAHGLCFSVQHTEKLPPSLKNIYKELEQDLQIPITKNGDLTHWAKQGVFMLNASLTVEKNKPMSHAKIGWEQFTDTIIKNISGKKEHVIFVLWGKFAQQKEALIDKTKHTILTAAHPSPLSAHKGFWGSKHFSKINKILSSKNQSEIKF